RRRCRRLSRWRSFLLLLSTHSPPVATFHSLAHPAFEPVINHVYASAPVMSPSMHGYVLASQ
ncbi:hypothetical protein PIB30_103092, partial [Stylosanthes scabra]|nr:hypothetical protein [Stylosanthes scabra]